MKIGIVVFPGSNCDRDVYVAVEAMLRGQWDNQPVPGEKVQKIWHADGTLPDLDLVILPGGFSYGDYLRSGAMAARSPVMDAVKKHAAKGRYVLGICNGFQVLTESGLLPGTLMRNARLSFLCRNVHLRVEQTDSAFTRRYKKGQVIEVPIAHHDGNYVADEGTLKALEDGNQVLFRYSEADGSLSENANPNGSARHIAGIVNRQGNVAGMMPHPERVCDVLTGSMEGRHLFESILAVAS